MSLWNTLQRLTEAYVWPSLRKDLRSRIRRCPTCALHNRRPEHVPMGEMSIAIYPMQIIGADLIGPLTETPHGHK
jgi:hypothetical protein